MLGWFSKKSETPETQVAEPDAPPASQAPPVMREVPSRPMAPPGAATASPPPRNGAPVEAPPAPDHLIEWLMHTTPDTRIAAARELGRGGDRRAVEPLIQALSDIHPPVRIAVANALGKLRDERAIDALATVLAEDEEIVRTAARGALEAIGTTLANAVLAEDDRRRQPPRPAPVTPVTTEQKPAESDGGMSWLVKGVQSDDAAVHGPAMTALAEAGPAAVDPLIALLSDGHVWTRKRAAELLGRIGDIRAAESLAKAIDSITREDRSYESYALREALRAALASVSPPPPVEEPAAVEAETRVDVEAPVEAQAIVQAPVEVSVAVEPPPAVSQPEPPRSPAIDETPRVTRPTLPASSRIEFLPSASETTSSAKPQAEEVKAPEPARFIAGISDATDQQLGERLREIAQAALGGGRPPLDSFDARRGAARVIGTELHRRGGRTAMERALDEYVGNSFGRHPVSQAWDGVGEWMG